MKCVTLGAPSERRHCGAARSPLALSRPCRFRVGRKPEALLRSGEIPDWSARNAGQNEHRPESQRAEAGRTARRRIRLGHDRRRSRRLRLRRIEDIADGERVRRHRRALSARGAFPQPHPHGAARIRQGRIPLFQISAARSGRRIAHGALRPCGDLRQRLERADEYRHALSESACRLSENLSQGRPDAPYSALAAIRRRRFQLPAPGPLRRSRLPVAGHRASVGARAGILPAANSS